MSTIRSHRPGAEERHTPLANHLTVARTLNRVITKQHLGPDAQVADKALAFMPTDPALTDPFLALAEDWFSAPGFEWCGVASNVARTAVETCLQTRLGTNHSPQSTW